MAPSTLQRRLSSNKTPTRQLSTQRSTTGVAAGVTDKKDAEEEPVELPGFFTIWKLNAPEGWLIFIATLGSVLIGGSMPVFAIFFSEVIKVSAPLI